MMISVSCSHTAGDPGDMGALCRPGGSIHEDTYSWIQSAWLAPVSALNTPRVTVSTRQLPENISEFTRD